MKSHWPETLNHVSLTKDAARFVENITHLFGLQIYSTCSNLFQNLSFIHSLIINKVTCNCIHLRFILQTCIMDLCNLPFPNFIPLYTIVQKSSVNFLNHKHFTAKYIIENIGENTLRGEMFSLPHTLS